MLLLVASICIPMTISAQTGEILFRENFNTNDYDWEVYEGEGVFSDIVDGVYVMSFEEAYEYTGWGVAPGFNNFELAPQFSPPYEWEMTVQNAQSSSGHLCVYMLYNMQENYDCDTILYCDSGWVGYSTWASTTFDTIETTTAIDLLDGSHQFLLRVEPDSVELSIDGETISTLTDVDNRTGSIGIGLSRDADSVVDEVSIEFDDIIVRTVEEKDSSDLPTLGEIQSLIPRSTDNEDNDGDGDSDTKEDSNPFTPDD